MKSNKNVRYLIGKGLSNKTISTLSESQIKILVEKFKKENKEQTQVVTQVYDSKNPEEVKKLNQALQDPTTLQGKNVQVKETEMVEDVAVDKNDAGAGKYSQDPHQVQAPDAMGDEGSAVIDKEEDLATEGVIKEKFESKAQQGLFWARCNKCSSKNCKWCKMAKEFSDSTSKKQYKTMPEKKHPEKTVKKETKENLEKFLEKKISEMVDNTIKPKMTKKDLINTIKKKSKKSESMILRKPKKMTMFSDEAPMELPIDKMFSIGKK
jgi:hypothetical protein